MPVGPFDGRIDAALVRRYAEATNDPSPRVRAGEVVPPVALVTQIWEAQEAGRVALVDATLPAMVEAAVGGVHGEHDIVLHRPIDPGEPLRTLVDLVGARPAGRNVLATLRYTTRDEADDVVAEQWWTTVYVGTTCDPIGDPAPDHAFPDDARTRTLGAAQAVIDEAMAHRYAEVSHDWSAHHFDLEAARRSGFDSPFLHGLCTMAICTHGVVGIAAGGDPERVRRVAVRFASPAFLGDEVVTKCYDAGPGVIAFEATSDGRLVIGNGRVELR